MQALKRSLVKRGYPQAAFIIRIAACSMRGESDAGNSNNGLVASPWISKRQGHSPQVVNQDLELKREEIVVWSARQPQTHPAWTPPILKGK